MGAAVVYFQWALNSLLQHIVLHFTSLTLCVGVSEVQEVQSSASGAANVGPAVGSIDG